MGTVFENDRVRVAESYDGMTYKVTCLDKSFRSKTFKGEFAWADAQRYASDNTNDFIYLG